MAEIGWRKTTVVDRKQIEFHDAYIRLGHKMTTTDKVKKMKKHRLYPAKTIKTLPDYLPSRGIFLVETASHVLCVRAGQIHDWTKKSSASHNQIHRISRIEKVTTQ